MLMAAIGDIHGNAPALDAVLAAVDEAGIQTVVNTGDIVVGFPFCNEAADTIRTRAIPSVQGEMDRLVARFLRKAEKLRETWSPHEFETLQWTYDHVRGDVIEYLSGLPRQLRLTLDGISVFVCHGSPGSSVVALEKNDSLDRFRRNREIANTSLIFCGRTHDPFVKRVDDTLFVNPGSVGIPGDKGPRAYYAIINTEEEPSSAEIASVEYDMALLDERLREVGLQRP